MFGRLTPMVKNLLILNIGVYVIGWLLKLDMSSLFAFYGFHSPKFQPYQLFTYMFLHDSRSWFHLFSNMLGLFIFGPILESFWGSNRFLKYYLITGIGAGILYAGVNYIEFNATQRAVQEYINHPSPEEFYGFLRDHFSSYEFRPALVQFAEQYDNNPNSAQYAAASVDYVKDIEILIRDGGMVGASGAIFGLLIAVGLLFPNTQIMLLIPPIPMKMKYLALIMGGMAIYGALHRTPGDNVAHYAHLGGMLVGYVMIKIWNKDRNKFY